MNSSMPRCGKPGLRARLLIDQSHNVTDPIESLMASAMEIVRAYVQASLVDRKALVPPKRKVT
jgi:L-rhamnose isomerase/sugar isomerase